jgi:molybdopterin converting factor small subunit
VKVLFYGRLAEALGPELEIDAARCTVADLRERLIFEHPDAAETLASSRSRAFTADTLVDDDHILDGSKILEFLPPVSGG